MVRRRFVGSARPLPSTPALDVSQWARPGDSATDALVRYIELTRPQLTTYRERFAEALRLGQHWRIVCKPPRRK